MTKDFIGNELNIDDKVVYSDPSYKHLKVGYIRKLNTQKVTIVGSIGSDSIAALQFYKQIMKFPEEK